MANYANGTKFEYFVRDYYKAMGCYVVRSAGSHGSVDLIAWNSRNVFLIQCKKTKVKKGFADDLLKLLAVPVADVRWHRLLIVKHKESIQIVTANGNSRFVAVKAIKKFIAGVKNDNYLG